MRKHSEPGKNNEEGISIDHLVFHSKVEHNSSSSSNNDNDNIVIPRGCKNSKSTTKMKHSSTGFYIDS